VDFIHGNHVVRHDINCFRCHTRIEHGEFQLVETLEVQCESCHQDLHIPEKEMYMGTGGWGVPDKPSRMFAAQVACDGCHPKLGAPPTGAPGKVSGRAGDFRSRQEACVRCHGKGYDRMLTIWIREMNKLKRQFQPAVERLERVIQRVRLPARKKAQADSLFARIQHNYQAFAQGHGAHNVEYAVNLMKRVRQDMEQLFRILGQPETLIPNNPLLVQEDAYCQVLCHNIAKPADVLRFEHMQFPHKTHTEDIGLACTLCHSPEKHKMRLITRSGCMNCHHEQQDIPCSSCHLQINRLYTGDLSSLGVQVDPDIMALAEVDCQGCHDVTERGDPLEKALRACVACHEEGYDEMLSEWHNELQNQMAEVVLKLQQLDKQLKSRRLPYAKRKAWQARLQEVRRLYEFLEKARPDHNPEAARTIIDQIKSKLDQFLSEMSS